MKTKTNKSPTKFREKLEELLCLKSVVKVNKINWTFVFCCPFVTIISFVTNRVGLQTNTPLPDVFGKDIHRTTGIGRDGKLAGLKNRQSV